MSSGQSSVIFVVRRPEDAHDDQDEADDVGVGTRTTDEQEADQQEEAAHLRGSFTVVAHAMEVVARFGPAAPCANAADVDWRRRRLRLT